jgi:hypothetical protein
MAAYTAVRSSEWRPRRRVPLGLVEPAWCIAAAVLRSQPLDASLRRTLDAIALPSDAPCRQVVVWS